MPDLRVLLEAVPNPRDPRGVRHSLVSVLVVAAVAVAAGARSLTAIGEWAADAPQPLLERLGVRFDARRGRWVAPGESTIRRVLSRVDGDAVDAAVSAWTARRAPAREPDAPVVVAVDGKSLAGTYPREGGAGVYLVAVLRHDDGVVLAQRRAPTGGGEPAAFAPLLDTIDLEGVVVTADALHTTRANVDYLRARGAHFVDSGGSGAPDRCAVAGRTAPSRRYGGVDHMPPRRGRTGRCPARAQRWRRGTPSPGRAWGWNSRWTATSWAPAESSRRRCRRARRWPRNPAWRHGGTRPART
ncbi:ISAs1 family transposase [Saccharothrix sp.]|uniref:ISAs1 family transposase n=1 Tax=Saccharothrix sp. TaxID=1873460 RepID=UPI002810BD9F|nr:ISAs1 family transposase [Saccharothrix sp.]